MPGIQWIQQLLEIEQRESTRQPLLRNYANAIFDMLKTEVARCIEEWNAAPRAGGNRLLVVDITLARKTKPLLSPYVTRVVCAGAVKRPTEADIQGYGRTARF